jgi:hypothetical protein
MEDYIRLGRTARETFEILKRELDEAGFIVNDSPQYDKYLDYDKTQVFIDAHGLSEDPYPGRIGSLGPAWQRDWVLQPIHHFTTEYFVYMGLPHAKHEVKYLNLWFHDGAYVTERGVEYLYPPQKDIYLIR